MGYRQLKIQILHLIFSIYQQDPNGICKFHSSINDSKILGIRKWLGSYVEKNLNYLYPVTSMLYHSVIALN